MPNWVDNNLRIHGTEQDLDRFVKEIHSKTDDYELSFESIVPIDRTKYRSRAWFSDGKTSLEEFGDYSIKDHLYDTRTYNDAHVTANEIEYDPDPSIVNENGDHFAGWVYDWYTAQRTEWGVKWDASSIYLSRMAPDHVELSFNTPWGIPAPVLYAMAEKYPTLKFEYYCTEESDDFFVHGESEDGHMRLYETPYGDIFTPERKREAVASYLLDTLGLDPKLYDLDGIVDSDEGYFNLADFDGYGGFTDPVIDYEPYESDGADTFSKYLK